MIRFRAIKFGSKTCGACVAMDRAKTLERLAEANPDLELVKLDIGDEEGDCPRGSTFDDAFKLSDAYEVESLPTIIFESLDGGELAREEGGLAYRQLEKLFESAKKRSALKETALKILGEQKLAPVPK